MSDSEPPRIGTHLERVQPTRTRYKFQKGHRPISEIFTISDEVFALFVVYNEHLQMVQEGKKGSYLYLVKLFVNGRSGDKGGLPVKAIKFFCK